MDTLVTAKTRYATKAYDAEKKIPKQQFEKLLEVLRFSPSSVNIQPWHFIVAETDAAKQRIAAGLTGSYIYNAAKVLNSSHTIIFCTRTDISTEYLEQLLQQDELSGRFKDETAKQGQRDTRQGYVEFYRNELKNLPAWMENQTYLALGQLLFAAGLEGIDATPMEGFDRNTINQEFGLAEKGLKASVIVSLGYRSETDFNAKLPKSRLADEVIFTRL
ncbi:oxygen-insensitive NAD(P)H nitroreductase [Acinetobacter haemolyticus]|uniref:Oxygen-insensitive NAD(P)H nitroreductase n=1 Tax=Acinetobacter haemolyticus TaxID=29430 RepID=A0A4P7B7T9_ACIHA|nr:oxygen-insensitive NAD(P)H nitroreductase [Acinetobacter haemolyticus]NAR19321.1 oxygen-insensitive NAD(P)H nitroreductase [Acinetobacter haemolyticus]NAR37204.1 oxygen-insensitive NAD(P)H nitroreductase [Acinetobacter haemolyticus]NAR47025.1 oxygen-insensitive NAD(P)H nitroreductase [Acinetobacter haemolyticus]QBQ16540.1 oxygen-insensitive NAD(P)H nitroreductase [Acinetobacter haemolyticus]QHI20129.1 oxygen-insensitive NAD(P)H nitroreductase [Acinetobacter haemolyticus]